MTYRMHFTARGLRALAEREPDPAKAEALRRKADTQDARSRDLMAEKFGHYPYRGYVIRTRERRLASPPEGLKQAWTEWQVWAGRKIVARFDLRHQAEAWVDLKEDGRHGADA